MVSLSAPELRSSTRIRMGMVSHGHSGRGVAPAYGILPSVNVAPVYCLYGLGGASCRHAHIIMHINNAHATCACVRVHGGVSCLCKFLLYLSATCKRPGVIQVTSSHPHSDTHSPLFSLLITAAPKMWAQSEQCCLCTTY